MARLELVLFGGFHATVDSAPVTGFATDKTRALLAYLGVEAGQAHARDTLAGLLWPELPDDAARRNLRHALFKLRQALGQEEEAPGWLQITAKAVYLDPAADFALDVTAFTALLAACRAHRHRSLERCTAVLQKLSGSARVSGRMQQRQRRRQPWTRRTPSNGGILKRKSSCSVCAGTFGTR